MAIPASKIYTNTSTYSITSLGADNQRLYFRTGDVTDKIQSLNPDGSDHQLIGPGFDEANDVRSVLRIDLKKNKLYAFARPSNTSQQTISYITPNFLHTEVRSYSGIGRYDFDSNGNVYFIRNTNEYGYIYTSKGMAATNFRVITQNQYYHDIVEADGILYCLYGGTSPFISKIKISDIINTVGDTSTPRTDIAWTASGVRPTRLIGVFQGRLYLHSGKGENNNVFVMDLDGSNQRSLNLNAIPINATDVPEFIKYNQGFFFLNDKLYYKHFPDEKIFEYTISTGTIREITSDGVSAWFVHPKFLLYSTNTDFKSIYKATFNQPPNKPVIQDYSKDVYNPTTTGMNPLFKFTMDDPDLDPLTAYQKIVKDVDTNQVVTDYTPVISPTPSGTIYTTTGGIGDINQFVPGKKYSIMIRVRDLPGDWSEYSDTYYFRPGELPQKPTITSLTNNQRVNTTPTVEFNVGTHTDDHKQNFKVSFDFYMVDPNTGQYKTTVQQNLMFTSSNPVNWEAFNGTEWVPFPAGGIKQSEYPKVRVLTNISNSLKNSKTIVKAIPHDMEYEMDGPSSNPITVKVGNKLDLITAPADVGTTRPQRCYLQYIGSVYPQGVTFQILVSNNANDAEPSWQDVTADYMQGHAAVLTNTTKTADTWAMSAHIIIEVDNTVIDKVYLDGIGGSVD